MSPVRKSGGGKRRNMKYDYKDTIPLFGEYAFVFLVSLGVGILLDTVLGLILGEEKTLLRCCLGIVLHLIPLAVGLSVYSARLAIKQQAMNIGHCVKASVLIFILQFGAAFLVKFATFVSGAGFWIGELLGWGTPHTEADGELLNSGYYACGLLVAILLSYGFICLGQFIGYRIWRSKRKLYYYVE
jgi:hypothetical protein